MALTFRRSCCRVQYEKVKNYSNCAKFTILGAITKSGRPISPLSFSDLVHFSIYTIVNMMGESFRGNIENFVEVLDG